MLTGWWQAVLDLVYPPKCPGCRTKSIGQGTWCSRCREALSAAREISPYVHHLRAVNSCRTLYEYEGALKRVIHDVKFRRAKRYGPHLDWLLRQARPEQFLRTLAIHAVVPVPLHKDRLAERGFNQTELVFRSWAADCRWQWLDALERVRKTRPQWELSLDDRRSNIRGAFQVIRPEAVKGYNILLVDDIFTTGLTLEECAKVLKKAGAREVHCLTLASSAR